MSTEVKLRRGTTSEHSSFTGVQAEVTIDTTKSTVVVHDGATAGGHPLLKESSIGSSVQAYDSNLASFVSIFTLPTSDGTSNQVLKTDGAGNIGFTTIAGGGTVTSVGMSVPTGLSITGSPVTTTGTLAVSLQSGYSIPTTSSQGNWDTAYGWGDHSTEGYLTSYTETDPVYTASSWYSTTNNSSNWDTAYGWGNHASAGYLTTSTAASTYQPLDGDLTAIGALTGTSGLLKKTAANTWSLDTATYLTSYTETDPVFVASAAYNITSTNISNWNTAYGWGNHASAGYLTSSAIGSTVQAYDADLTTWAGKTSPSGTVVGTTDTQTLTGKTISADNNTISGIAASSFVLTNSSGNVDGSAGQKEIPAGVVVGTSDTQTLTNKTLTTPILSSPTMVGTLIEDVFTITDGAGFAIDPTNGSIQLVTLGASRTPTVANFDAGEAVTLMINDGTAYTITWSTIGVVWVGGTAPTLATSGYTVIELWRVGSTYYGALVGNVA